MACYRFEKLSPRLLLDAAGLAHSDADSVVAQVAVAMDEHGADPGGGSHGQGAHDSNPHQDDPLRGAEHERLLNLIPHEMATHRVARDGVWSDASTWDAGVAPEDDAHVLVPEGMTLTVDMQVDARLETMRVDGTLRFAADEHTYLALDTLVVSPTGTLEIGTADAPIAADVSARMLFTDDAFIDYVWDPTFLSRGLISHGKVSIHGAAKDGSQAFLRAPRAGDDELLFREPVEGWQVGDRVLVPGVVRPTENNRGVTLVDEDEIATIAAVSTDGRRVTLDRALAYDHAPPQGGLDVPASNLDRNVVFESENKTDPQRAGHVMFMHNPDVTVNHAAFRHIGRNDKSVPTTDPQLDDEGRLIGGTGNNPRGRYAVHFHRTGSESLASTVTGAVVENAPGWGFVNHDSHVVFTDNVTYNVTGSGFVTEIGSERGAFVDNVAIRSSGKPFYQPLGASDKDTRNGFGSAGHGFWLQSAGVALVGNVAAGHAQEGIFINNRLVTEPGRDEPTYTSLVNVPAGTPVEFESNDSEPTFRDDLIHVEHAPLAEVRGNSVFASGAGLAVRWRRPTSAVAEGDDGDVIEGLEVWNVEWAGVHLGYSTGLTIRNSVILGDLTDPIPLSAEEQADRLTQTSEARTAQGKGIAANRNSRDLTIENVYVGGFTVGIQALTNSTTWIRGALLQNIENLVVVTPQSTELSNGARRIHATGVYNWSLSKAALGGATPYSVRMIKQLDRAGVAGGTQPDQEFGAFVSDDEVYYNGHRLYFADQHADAIPFPEGATPDFFAGAPYRDYIGQTSEVLLEDFGLALSGAVAPAGAAALPGIDGLAVELAETPPPPSKVEFRFDAESSDTRWTLGESDLAIDWQTKGISPDASWRVYLNGPSGTQEIARSELAESEGTVLSRQDVEGWQEWRFSWPTVGQFPPWWIGEVVAGEYTLIASAEDGPAVYLGRVTIDDPAEHHGGGHDPIAHAMAVFPPTPTAPTGDTPSAPATVRAPAVDAAAELLLIETPPPFDDEVEASLVTPDGHDHEASDAAVEALGRRQHRPLLRDGRE